MKMYIPFIYQKTGKIEVDATSIEEGKEKAQEILNKMTWAECENLSVCVDDSDSIDEDGIIYDEDSNIIN